MNGPSGRCAKCGGAQLFPAMVADRRRHHREDDLNLRVDTEPEAFLFKGSARAAVHASVCATCGFAELYVTEPQELYRAYLASQQHS
jgi:predicted nucleic-acid-binding Zn-ribbon protein